MARVTKINVGGTNYDIAHEGELKNSGFEVVTSLPTTNLFEGRMVSYNNSIYFYDGSHWIKITEETELSLVASTGNYTDLNGLPEHLNFYNIADADKSGSVEESIHHCGLHPCVIAKLNNKTFYPTIDISDEGTISWDFSTLSTTDKLSLLIIGSSLDKGSDAYDTLQSQINHNTLEINNLKSGLPSGPSIVEIEEELYSYGIEKDLRISTSTCTRVGNLALHRTLPVQSGMRGCLLDDNGNIVEYLPQNDWTTATRDGSRGQVMVLIPGHYRKFYTKDEGNIIGVRISLNNIEGYHYVPDMFVSAYEASWESSSGKLCSVVNYDANYRGGYSHADWDGTYRSLLGRPKTYMNRTGFRSAARKRNTANTSWNCYLYHVHKALFWLYTVEYANLNSQAKYNSELTSEGFRQGGLGEGVSNWATSEWETFNSFYPFVPCGHTDTLGNRTGVVPYTAYNEDGSVFKVSNVPRYRGIENLFGHITKSTDGINVRISPTEANGGDNLSKVFVCEDPSKLNDTNYNGYKYVGNEARTDGYTKEIIFGEEGEIISSLVGGTSTTFFCDSHYTHIPTKEELRGVLFGGYANHGASDGLACLNLGYIPLHSFSHSGSRLCFIPQK